MRQNGFTFVELIMVIVITGILAAVIVPRLANNSTYGDLGFYNDVKFILRYAQKAAVAQRRPVCVNFTATTVYLTYDPAFGATTPNCTSNLVGPEGQPPVAGVIPPYTVSAGSQAGFAAVPANFYFNPQGQPSATPTVTFSSGAPNVTITADTGYVP